MKDISNCKNAEMIHLRVSMHTPPYGTVGKFQTAVWYESHLRVLSVCAKTLDEIKCSVLDEKCIEWIGLQQLWVMHTASDTHTHTQLRVWVTENGTTAAEEEEEKASAHKMNRWNDNTRAGEQTTLK